MHNEMEIRFLSLSGNEGFARAAAAAFSRQIVSSFFRWRSTTICSLSS